MLNAQTLVLDANWNPIDLAHWTDGIRKILNEKAELLEAYTDNEIGMEWKHALQCPSVIRLLHFVQRTKDYRKFQKLTRRNVLLRDNHECQYCGCHLTTKNLSWDHLVPRDKGGRTTWKNIVSCCVPCNRKKANQTLEESGMVLRKKPYAPLMVAGERHSLFSDLKKLPSEKWRNYIYFNSPLNE